MVQLLMRRLSSLVLLLVVVSTGSANGPAWIAELSSLHPGNQTTCEVYIPEGGSCAIGVHNTDAVSAEPPPGVSAETLVVYQETRSIAGKERPITYYLAPESMLTANGLWCVILRAQHEGNYKVILKCNENAPEVNLHVVKGIPPADCGFGFYTNYNLYAYPDNEKLYFQQMVDKGCNTFTPYGWRKDGDDIARQMDLAIETGLARKDIPLMVLPCGGPEILNKAKAKGARTAEWPEMIGYNHDEPCKDDLKAVCERADEWRGGGYRTGTAAGEPSWRFCKYLDIVLVSMQFACLELKERFAEEKAEWWAYNAALRGTNAPLHRYHTGIWTFAVRPKTLLLWGYLENRESCVKRNGQWNPCRVNEHALPYKDGVLSTVGLEGFRDGVIDYRILRELEEAIQHNPDADATPGAAMWLQEQVEKVDWTFWPNGLWPTGYFWDVPDTAIPPLDCADMRNEAMAWLVKIRG